MHRSRAQRVMLDLLTQAHGPMSSNTLVEAASLLDVEPGAARVALTRLKSSKRILNPRRGVWELASDQRASAGRPWAQLQSRLVSWDGVSWLAVYLGSRGIPPSEITALQEWGFGMWDEMMWVRPDNLLGGVHHVRSGLVARGLDPKVTILKVSGWTHQEQGRAMDLWDVSELNQRYIDMAQTLDTLLSRQSQLSLQEAMPQVYETYHRVTGALGRDPLLPAPMIDVYARALCIERVRELERWSQMLWDRVLRG